MAEIIRANRERLPRGTAESANEQARRALRGETAAHVDGVTFGGYSPSRDPRPKR